MNLLLQIFLLAIGFTMLVKGADWFVDGAAGLAAKFGIPQLVIGLTIVAMGTSAPEAAVSITSALKGNAGITVGNVLGSNILNILIILGVTLLITKIAFSASVLRFDLPYMLAISLLFLIFGYTNHQLVFGEGLALLLLFAAYIGQMCWNAVKQSRAAGNTTETSNTGEGGLPSGELSLLRLLGAILNGLALVIFGSNRSVNAATEIAKQLGMSERFIGLTIVALGTSLPELFTSVSAALKDQSDISIGNIIGSNIFNILFVAGLTAVITPVPFEAHFVVDAAFAIASGILLGLLAFRRHLLVRWHGILMLAAYAGYFIYLIR